MIEGNKMAKNIHLSEMDNWTISALEDFKANVVLCGTWQEPPTDEIELKTLWLLRDISSHIGPMEYRNLVNGWGSYRHSSNLEELDTACNVVVNRISNRKNPI